MGDYGFPGAGEFGGQDGNFNCRPDGDFFMNKEKNIKDVGIYNRELLDREISIDEAIVPVYFNVSTRSGRNIYGNSFDNFPVKQIDFSVPSTRGFDTIRAYLFAGEQIEMKYYEGLSYIEGEDSLLVPILSGRHSPRKVLVKKDLGEFEKAVAVDVLSETEIVLSRDIGDYYLDGLDIWIKNNLNDANISLC